MPTQEEKQERVKLILILVDDINIMLETPGYERKYTPEEYELSGTADINRFTINSRESFRIFLGEEWTAEEITTEQKTDIEAALALTRNKITQIFANQ